MLLTCLSHLTKEGGRRFTAQEHFPEHFYDGETVSHSHFTSQDLQVFLNTYISTRKLSFHLLVYMASSSISPQVLKLRYNEHPRKVPEFDNQSAVDESPFALGW